MNRKSNAAFALLCATLTVGACTTDSPSESGLDHTTMTTTAVAGTGSRNVRPPENWNRHAFEGQPAPLTETIHPELPTETIAALKRGLTEAEVEALFGAPLRKRVEVQDVDTAGNDWNAWIWTWRHQDSRYGAREMSRDLEIYFGYVHAHKTFPDRPEIEGPAWVVIDWELN
jgi:hypothetical protein